MTEHKISVEPLTSSEQADYNDGKEVVKPDTSSPNHEVSQRRDDNGFRVERREKSK